MIIDYWKLLEYYIVANVLIVFTGLFIASFQKKGKEENK